MPYRPAIDGLRALAVVLVLLFHAHVPLFSGGYVGVDVFFVISGYLITTLILHEHDAGRFTLVGFYERRIRRIFPALFLVVFATLVVAAFVLIPHDLARLGASVAATAVFISNFYFWSQQLNYFQDRPQFEPLIHTWSLAIEEQFYLLFPIFMLVALRFSKRLEFILLGLAFVSFAISIHMTSAHPSAGFYFSPSRAWELLLGAWLAATRATDLVPRRAIPALQATGLAMIAGAALSYDARMPFPGFAALLPCIGTVLVIGWCDQRSRLVSGLSHPACVWLGLISYPLYLWHWPLLVFARIVLLREPAAHEIAVIYLLSGVLAAATWHYVERPIRAGRGLLPVRHVFASAAAVGCLAFAIGGGLSVKERVWSTPPPPAVAHLLAAARDFAPLRAQCHNWNRRTPDHFSDCIIGNKNRPQFDFALWGDSHAGSVATAVDAAANSVGQKGLQLTSDNCPPVLQTQGVAVAEDCEARNKLAFDLLREHRVRRVIFSGQWFQYIVDDNVLGSRITALQRGLMETIERLRVAHIDVVIVGPVPYIGWNVPSVLADKEWRKEPLPLGPSFDEFMRSQRLVMSMLERLTHDGVYVMYPHEQLCTATCLVQLNGEVLYSDDEHLTTRGADLLWPMFIQQLSRPHAVPERR